ncbi:DNA polymerase delta subunit 4-like [Abrus precatorius]|uniref:DNA polymerase delta subunit 4-like n=1 Tax=Abrus precatorius TaxID=3816 RepID=A0A8B8K4L9_ABRPR|nr:DNA polymerase delta subunit 4-like [Abrus precatorius]
MKRFYKQRKNGIDKPSKSKKKSQAVTEYHDNEYTEEEKILREFDMNVAYGPCIGLTRLERWERAHKFGLNPPQHIKILLESDKAQLECLWNKHK